MVNVPGAEAAAAHLMQGGSGELTPPGAEPAAQSLMQSGEQSSPSWSQAPKINRDGGPSAFDP